jgi:hypothetical protein
MERWDDVFKEQAPRRSPSKRTREGWRAFLKSSHGGSERLFDNRMRTEGMAAPGERRQVKGIIDFESRAVDPKERKIASGW